MNHCANSLLSDPIDSEAAGQPPRRDQGGTCHNQQNGCDRVCCDVLLECQKNRIQYFRGLAATNNSLKQPVLF
jgi:hypothetical protein